MMPRFVWALSLRPTSGGFPMRAVLPLACVIALAAIGCGDDPIVIIPDDTGGGGNDAGMGDTGGGVTDTGVDAPASGPCGTVNAAELEPLPASCLPRCSAATFSAVAGCSGATAAMCQQNAVAADTTPGALVNAGGAAPQEFTCDECFGYQIQSCLIDTCSDEMMAFLACAATDPATANSRCATEIMAINTCQMVMANQMAIQACQQTRVLACFDM